MSTLYLHCGYHKTGSSFLQTMFVRNRELLKQASIWHPYSLGELEMQRGINTLGNGKDLMDTLSSEDAGKTVALLTKDLDEAKMSGCESLLYSAEGLFHLFPKNGVLPRLSESASSAGFKKIKALIYFRDPVSHALSTYKHRAKRGDHADFKIWITNSYETMGLLDSFCSYRMEHDIEWCCRKYRSNSVYMTRSAFVKWLGTEMPGIPADDRVNSSLTLSEIGVLQGVKEIYDAAIPHLYDKFIALPKEQKSQNGELENYFTEIAATFLSGQKELVARVNEILPDDENLEITDINTDADNQRTKPEISLTPKQTAAIAVAMKNTAEAERMPAKVMDLWKRGTRKIKRTIKAAGF